MQTAYFACGCFWSKEYAFARFPGVVATRVGFMGGHLPHPSYRQVCSKTTGHAETVEVVFDPKQTTYGALARFFFEIHDPTAERSSSYRSAIFYTAPAQEATARAILDELKARGYPALTEVAEAGPFWEAEERHQQYCDRRGLQPRIKRKTRFSGRTGGSGH